MIRMMDFPRRRRRGRAQTFECPICFENITENATNHTNLECCKKKVCNECLKGHCSSVINEGILNTQCLFRECNKYLPHGTIVKSLDEKEKKIFNTMLIDMMKDPCIKTCPGCSKPEKIEPTTLKEMNTSQQNWHFFSFTVPIAPKVTCSCCFLSWCFICHAPWHSGLRCKDYLLGSKEFKNWMKSRNNAQFNAHYCPQCRIPIQRASGCPNMVCSKCNTPWCYDCGYKTKDNMALLGPHFSAFAMRGCLNSRYLFLNNIPLTYFIRLIALFAKIGFIFALGFLLSFAIFYAATIILMCAISVLPLCLLLERMSNKYSININTVKPMLKGIRFPVFVIFYSVCIGVFIFMLPAILVSMITVLPLVLYLKQIINKSKN